MKKNEGITLIALIITIIILIILTAITISNVTNSNLFGLAKGATENYIQAGKEEQEALDKIMGYLKNGKQEDDDDDDEPAPEKKPTEVTKLPLTDVYSSGMLNSLKKYTVAHDDIVDSVFTSYDSQLINVVNQCIVGHNSWKLHRDDLDHNAANNYNMLYSIEFTTNAKEFIFAAIGSLRVSVDENDGKGYQYTSEEGELDIEADQSYLDQWADGYTMEKFRFIKVSFEDSKERNIKIELMGAFSNLYTDAQYEVKKIEKAKPKTMMFVGDSWTTGHSTGGNSLPYRSYPTIIANNLGMTAINLGVGGSGYTDMTGGIVTNYKERMQYSKDACHIEPNYVFICGGGNDVTDVKWAGAGTKTLDQVATAAEDCWKYAKEAYPSAKVIVLGLEYAIGGARYEASNELKQLNETLKGKAKNNQIPYIDFVNGKAFDENGNEVTRD